MKYLTSGPVLAVCLQRVNAVKKLLELLGPEDPAQARTEDLPIWRASYGSDRLHYGVYGSKTLAMPFNLHLVFQKLFDFNYVDKNLGNICRLYCVIMKKFSRIVPGGPMK